MERQFARRMLLQQIEHRFALAENIRAIMFGGDGIIAEIGEEFRFGHGAPRVLRHDLDLFARRDLLQFDKVSQ